MAEGTKEKRVITVASVGSWRNVGKGKKLDFVGADHVSYETWEESIGEFVKAGAKLNAEVEFTVSESKGVTYPHNKIISLFDDQGKPIAQREARGGGYGARGGSQEESPEKRKSIEDQNRAEIIKELWIGGKLEDTETSQLKTKLVKWLEKIDVPPPAAKTNGQPPKESAPVKTDGFANAGEFLTACFKNLKVNKKQVLEKLALQELPEGFDYQAAYDFLAKG